MATYTRRAEELIKEIRMLSYSEQYSETEGWNNNAVVDILNLAQNRVYGAVTGVTNPANVEEYGQPVVAGQQSYDIPIEVQMGVRIIDVRFFYGTQSYEFVTLQEGDIQDRFDFPTNIPMLYTIRNRKILLSPTPNVSYPNGLVINYQKRLRTLDIRRGKVLSRSLGPPFTLTLDFTYLSQKDAGLQANADSVLDDVDYCCLVDRTGEPIMTKIPLSGYNSRTRVLTAVNGYAPDADSLAALDAAIANGDTVYVTQGEYSSTNSQLDSQCEDGMIEISVGRLLSLQSDAAGRAEYAEREAQVLDRLASQYRRYRPSVQPVRWLSGRGVRTFPFGAKGIN